MKDRINLFIFLPLTFAAFLLETAFLPSLSEGSWQPHLVLILLIASVLLSASADFLYTAFVFGFLFDIYSGAAFGIMTATLVFTAIFAAWMKYKFLKEEGFFKVAGVSTAIMLFYNLCHLSLLSLSLGAGAAFMPEYVWRKIILDAFVAGVLVYPVERLISNGKE